MAAEFARSAPQRGRRRRQGLFLAATVLVAAVPATRVATSLILAGARSSGWRVLCGRTGAPPVATRLRAARRDKDEYLDEPSLDFLSGETFSRRAILNVDSDRSNVQFFLALTALLAAIGLAGLFYYGVGQLAILSTPGAKPGLDSFQGVVLEVLGVVLGGGGFVALSQGRTKTIRRLDRELAFRKLEYEPVDGIGMPGRLSDVCRKQRVLILFGAADELGRAVQAAAVYRRRWITSGVQVVAVGVLPKAFGGRWLARALCPEDWESCRDELRNTEGGGAAVPGSASWLLLGKSGRVRGSGDGYPCFDEIVSFVGVEDNLSLLPPRAVAIRGEYEDALQEVLAVHDAFYEALKDGDWAAMCPLWMEDAIAAAEPADTRKGRVPWASVLSDRAAVEDVVDVDVVFSKVHVNAEGEEEEVASITSIEVCAGRPGLFNEGGPGGKGTLLATKRLKRDPEQGGLWRIVSHQTIPYCRNTLSTQSLRCNANGCVLLKPGG